jgi:cell division protein ZapA (FtsZ GTPase activity inhibitor)
MIENTRVSVLAAIILSDSYRASTEKNDSSRQDDSSDSSFDEDEEQYLIRTYLEERRAYRLSKDLEGIEKGF